MFTNLDSKDIRCRLVAAHAAYHTVHNNNVDSAKWEGRDLLSAVHRVWKARNEDNSWRPSDGELLSWKRGRGACSSRDMSDHRKARYWLSWARMLLCLFGMV